MATRLENLKINEISFVDRGANKGARVTIYKAAAKLNPLLKATANPLMPVTKQAPSTLEEAARRIQLRDGCSRTEAMTRARRAFPDLLALHEAQGRNPVGKQRGSPDPKLEQQLADRLDDELDEEDEDTMTIKTFNDAVEVIKKRDNCSTIVAMRRARVEHGDLFKAYQAEGGDVLGALDNAVTKANEITAFEKLVDRIQARDRSSRIEALMKAAREFPVEREAYATALS
jgi:hypothetical protein